MIALVNVSKQFGGRTILESASWLVSPGERVGLVGANGAGKSTLLKMVCGVEEADEGEVQRPRRLKLGYLAQEPPDLGSRTLHDVLWDGLAEIRQVGSHLQEVADRLASAESAHLEDLVVEQSRLVERFEAMDGYEAEARVARVASGLGFSQSALAESVASLSGGWQMRAALGRLLLSAPDVLLLDEPTNHLDIAAIEWLESYLLGLGSAVVVVSHDRAFLDRIATRITEIDRGHLSEFSGNYSDYVRQRQARDEALASAADRQEREMARAWAFIERFRASARRTKSAKSREKAVLKVERIEAPTLAPKVKFQFDAGPQSARLAIELRQLSKRFGDRTVLESIDLEIERGMRIALVGPNGSGKSTLLRLIAGEQVADTGRLRLGQRVSIGHYAQHAADRLDPRKTVLEAAYAAAPDRWSLFEVRSLLAGFLFRGEAVDKVIQVLSGGERARLALAILLLEPHNVLLLDEPTNHLDMDSKEVLAQALARFGGTLLMASHDRYVLDQVATHVLVLPSARLYEGSYGSNAAAIAEAAVATGPSRIGDQGMRNGSDRAVESRPPEAERVRTPRFNAFKHARLLEDAEAQVIALEARAGELSALLADPASYSQGAGDIDFSALAGEYEAVQKDLAEANTRWEALVAQDLSGS